VNEEAIVRLLKAIEDLALLGYQHRELCDPRLTFALGQIGGIAIKAIADVRPKNLLVENAP
jgi:hypothetical protein